MNNPSQQLTAGYDLEIAYDQPLSPTELLNTVVKWLGNNSHIEWVNGRKVPVYHTPKGEILLLCKCTTYLGNPHPDFKKRIQIPDWWADYTLEAEEMGYDVRFIGVYHYKGFVVFTDFIKDNYMERRLHNSSAHVYINDIYKAATDGVFKKLDRNNNEIVCVLARHFADYLSGKAVSNNVLFDKFTEFNFGFPFGQWLTAVEAIQEMHHKHWSQWRQAEWAGFFLEYRFSHFTEDESVSPFINYVATQNKGHKAGKFDFDLYFPKHDFYGDLKASDIKKSSTPGNDQITTIECINQHNKLWYIVYEHDTIRDADRSYEATKFRNQYLKEIDHVPDEEYDEMSYCQRMKHSVRFMKMSIIELNRVNYHQALTDFNQGHQPDGSDRKVKFLINKSVLKNDNLVIYRHIFAEKQ